MTAALIPPQKVVGIGKSPVVAKKNTPSRDALSMAMCESGEDWLDESELMDGPPRSTSRDWRAVTVAASGRLVIRLTAARHHRTLLIALNETKVSAIPSSDCLTFTLQV
jgi:hypothetical protein